MHMQERESACVLVCVRVCAHISVHTSMHILPYHFVFTCSCSSIKIQLYKQDNKKETTKVMFMMVFSVLEHKLAVILFELN
jgi:hypothetical protein